MKTKLIAFVLTAVFCVMPSIAGAETGHGHDHDRADAPKGGRWLENTQPRAEFYVEKDNTVTVAFYDDALKPVPAADQSVTVVAGADGHKTTVEFEKKGDALVSKGPLPDGHALNLVVQFKQTPEMKPVNFRFVLEDHVCGACKRAEYACTCGH
jgi:hypothetical protein